MNRLTPHREHIERIGGGPSGPHSMRSMVRSMDRIDFAAVIASADLGAIIAADLGPPARGGRWRCPFHIGAETPNLAIASDGRHWRCWSGRCGLRGDAIDWLCHREGLSKIEAARKLAGVPEADRPPPRTAPRADRRRVGDRPRLPATDALALVSEAADRLWTPEGADALDYLRGRGLADETIRAARLGWTPSARGVPWTPPGVVIPWADRGRLALVKVRPPEAWRDRFPEGRRPSRYVEAWRDRPGLYVAAPIVPGRPVVLCEGELDALIVAQAVGDRAAVATPGSASGRVDPGILGPLVMASPWIVATDADPAGDRLADALMALAGSRGRRVRPPGPGKDWTDAHAAGRNRFAYYLGPHLTRGPTWDDLVAWRWGPALLPEDRPDLDIDELPNILAHEGSIA